MARLVRPHRSQEAGGGAARAETLALAVYDAGAGVAEARRVGQGVASNGATGAVRRPVASRQASK